MWLFVTLSKGRRGTLHTTYFDINAPHLILASLPSGKRSSGLCSTSTSTENSACIMGVNCCSKADTTSCRIKEVEKVGNKYSWSSNTCNALPAEFHSVMWIIDLMDIFCPVNNWLIITAFIAHFLIFSNKLLNAFFHAAPQTEEQLIMKNFLIAPFQNPPFSWCLWKCWQCSGSRYVKNAICYVKQNSLIISLHYSLHVSVSTSGLLSYITSSLSTEHPYNKHSSYYKMIQEDRAGSFTTLLLFAPEIAGMTMRKEACSAFHVPWQL